MFWVLYRHFRVPIDRILEPVWWRLCRWRAHQLRGMEAHYCDLASMPDQDPPTLLRLAEECGQFARLLEDDSAG